MGIVGPLISAWLLASVFVLITETQNDRFIISFNEIAGIFLEGFSVVAVVFSPYWIAVLGSGLVGFMLSRHFRKSSGGRNE